MMNSVDKLSTGNCTARARRGLFAAGLLSRQPRSGVLSCKALYPTSDLQAEARAPIIVYTEPLQSAV